jgi:ATP-binding cassette subfamily B protein
MKIPLKQYWNLLVSYLRPQWPTVTTLAVLILGGTGLQVVNPQIMRRFIDIARAGTTTDTLSRIAALFIGIALVQQAISVLSVYLGEKVGWTATNALRTDLADHCLRLDMSFHNARTPGEMIERVDGDVTALSNFFSTFVVQLLGNALLLVAVLALLYRETWWVGLAFTGLTVASLLILWRCRNIAVPRWDETRQAAADLFGFLEERLAGTEDIRSCGAKAYVMLRFYGLVRIFYRKELAAALGANIMVSAIHTLFAVTSALALGVGGWLFRRDAITIGTVYMLFHYSFMLMQPIVRITWQMRDLQRAGAGVKRVRELIETETKILDREEAGRISSLSRQNDEVTGRSALRLAHTVPVSCREDLCCAPTVVGRQSAVYLPSGPLAVTFQDVSFGYDVSSRTEEGEQASPGDNGHASPQDDGSEETEKEMVLHDLSFHVRPGAVLGLLGRTGSGKTTLTRLIFRLYDPDSGAIRLGAQHLAHSSAREPSADDGSNGDGDRPEVPGTLVDIRELPLADLRQRVGMVTQEIQLFHATVRDNLTFFNPNIPDERIMHVIDELGMGEWYASLPEGLDTELESGGGGLSAGEAQLLAFARIFLRDPGLVILDEASSRLDPATEHLIERAVDRLIERRTAIVIAHRLGTVQRADEILILEEGRICEHGARTALAGDPDSRFYSLLQTGLEEVLA